MEPSREATRPIFATLCRRLTLASLRDMHINPGTLASPGPAWAFLLRVRAAVSGKYFLILLVKLTSTSRFLSALLCPVHRDE